MSTIRVLRGRLCSDDLSESEVAVIQRHTLVPARAEILGGDLCKAALGEILILKTAPGENDSRLSHFCATATIILASVL
ncbi:MAG TPA: hypothetical protein VIT21_09430 [Chthoniobacterales bacterium]